MTSMKTKLPTRALPRSVDQEARSAKKPTSPQVRSIPTTAPVAKAVTEQLEQQAAQQPLLAQQTAKDRIAYQQSSATSGGAKLLRRGSPLYFQHLGREPKASVVGLVDERSQVQPAHTRPFTPQAGQSYPIEIHGQHRTIRFELTVDEPLANELAKHRATIDPLKGTLQLDGNTIPLHQWHDDEPWALYSNGLQKPVFVTRRLTLGLDPSLTLGRDQGAITLEIDQVLSDLPTPTQPTTTRWKGESLEVLVAVTPAARELMQQQGVELDLERGGLHRDGGFEPFFADAAREYRQATSLEPPPWLSREMAYGGAAGAFGVPRLATLDARDGELICTPRKCYNPGHRDRVFPEPVVCDVTPIETGDWHPARISWRPSVTIEAPSAALAEQAAEVCEQVLGRALAERDRIAPQREREIERARELVDALSGISSSNEESPETRILIAEARALCGVKSSEPWTSLDTNNALQARISVLRDRLNFDVTVVVVPAGKHWSAMPHVLTRDQPIYSQKTSTVAANYMLGGKTTVFLPEEDLAKKGLLCWHEVHHLLEGRLLDDSTATEVDELRRRTVSEDGPLARTYGALPREFWATFAELFEGTQGRAGQLWFKQQQPRLYEIMCHATGRTPV